MDNRYRPRSPPPARRYHDPRASTGFISTSFEPSYPSYPRSAVDQYPTVRHNSLYDAPVKRYSYRDDAYGAPVTRTEYPINAYSRPRNNSTLSTEGRRPLSMISTKNTSPPRYSKPLVSNLPRDGQRSPPLGHSAARDEASRYLVPARSGGTEHHQRNYSATRADVDRLLPASRAPRRGEYHQAGGYATSKGYGGARGVKDDDFSYTGPREQFARDYPIRPPQPRDPYPRRERPVSVMDIPEHKLPLSRRDMGPPPSVSRPSDRVDTLRRSGFDSEPDRPSDLPQRRHSMRTPVVHQVRDDDYGSARDDFDRSAPKPRRDRLDEDDAAAIKARQRELDAQYERDKEIRLREKEMERERERERDFQKERDRELRDREREREKDRDRDRDRERERERDRDRGERDRERERERPRNPEKTKRPDDERGGNTSPERSGGVAKAAAAGLAGVGATAIANAVMKSKKDKDEASDSDDRKERRRRHRHRDKDETEAEAREVEPPRERRNKEAAAPADDRGQNDSGYGTSRRGDESSESHDDDGGRRRHRHRRHRERDEAEAQAQANEPRLAPPDAKAERELSPGDDGTSHHHRHRREKSRTREPQLEAPDRGADGRTVSPGENGDDRPRRVQLVDPVEKKEDFKPRGILKPSRTTPFPEDPNPTREGVAPLKDAGKQGIPPGARWTKISRLLVNPEALERASERFEERDDYVIVLRVLTREEIAKFAEKTQELRAERERLWKEELEKRRASEVDQRPAEYDPDEAEEQAPQAAIDSKPAVPGMDTQTLLSGGDQAPEQATAPVPDIKLDESTNYSTNV